MRTSSAAVRAMLDLCPLQRERDVRKKSILAIPNAENGGVAASNNRLQEMQSGNQLRGVRIVEQILQGRKSSDEDIHA